jgi:sec-independent protein translocase protein TatB
MFDIGFGELAALAVIALFVFGPDRLPEVAAQAGRLARQLRDVASGARRELSGHLDPELASLDLTSMDPRRIARDVFSGEDFGGTNGANGAANGSAARRPQRPVGEGERPPYDADAT